MIPSLSSLSEVINSCENSSLFKDNYIRSIATLESTINNKKTIFIVGNGGSAAQAQHFAAELIGRFKLERSPYPAIALTTDTSAITAIGNDYGFDNIFSRQIEALGKDGDLLILLSTSGNSQNCLNAIVTAKKIGLKTIGLLGKDGGKMKNETDINVIVPSTDTARIQEIHLHLIHEWCRYVDKLIFEY